MFAPFDCFFYGHAPSKVCQYATTYDKVVHGLCYASINYMQTNIQKLSHGKKHSTRRSMCETKLAWTLI
jgi:hypothetical protein